MGFFGNLFSKKPPLLIAQAAALIEAEIAAAPDPHAAKERFVAATSGISVSLGVQLMLALRRKPPYDRPSNEYVLGYLWGFCEGFLQSSFNNAQTAAIAAHVYLNLYGPDAAVAMISEVGSKRVEPKFHHGMMDGGNEAVSFRHGNYTPMKLADHFKS